MGIRDLLKHLPGGTKPLQSFLESGLHDEPTVPIDLAGALWQCADRHAEEYLSGDYGPSLADLAKLLNVLRSMCNWKLKVYLDGRPNPHKQFENERRQQRADAARAANTSRGQIRNTPEYIAHAIHLCKFMSIDVTVAPYEADGQVAHHALFNSVIAVTVDSDLLAIGASNLEHKLRQLMVVKSFQYESYRMIDLEAPHTEGELPLYDLYLEHGRIIFQLYAACSGCDFTKQQSGLTGFGFTHFIKLMDGIDGTLTTELFSSLVWKEHQDKCEGIGLTSEQEVVQYFEQIVSIYSDPELYDEEANIIRFSGAVTCAQSQQQMLHMNGILNSRTAEPLCQDLVKSMQSMDCSQLLHKSAVNPSKIRGVQLPANTTLASCNVSVLRNYIAARGGSVTGNKPELIKHATSYSYVEAQVPRTYVDRHSDKHGSQFIKVGTSSTRSIEDILNDLQNQFCHVRDASNEKALINSTHQLFIGGHFEADYANISRSAPELKQGLINATFGHIGSSAEQKSIGDAYQRCLYAKELSYHAMAKVPYSHRCILITKIEASMKRDELTRNQTEDGSTKKQQYLVIQEVLYEPTNHIEHNHNLGVFVKVLRGYCTGCVAGQGNCRHQAEQLWFQFFHWTDERLGIDQPATIGSCGWRNGGKALVSDIRCKIYEQQTVKHEKTIENQAEKVKRGVKRDCTEGQSSEYCVYASAKKQQDHPLRYTPERCEPMWDALADEEDSDDEYTASIKRPCRAQVRWYGETDIGLRDLRGYVHWWGTDCEIQRFIELTVEHPDKTAVEIGEIVLSERHDLKLRQGMYTARGEEYEGDL